MRWKRNIWVLLGLWRIDYSWLRAVSGFSMDIRKRLPGIWRLRIQEKQKEIPKRRRIVDDLIQASNNKETQLQEILLKLNKDGSFRQCDEGYEEGKWMSGRWGVRTVLQDDANKNETTNFYLAVDRQYFGPPYDSLFIGEILGEGDKTSSNKNGNNNGNETTMSVQGSIRIGKFQMPKTDPSFFDKDPIVTNGNATGSFVLQQMLSFALLLSKEECMNGDSNDGNDNSADSFWDESPGRDSAADDDENRLSGCAFE
ncbi:expressed unknown protein [Seminavis robusta]|uniref:Uncharacterized protein n=1 Tax=Seminavis robusta TaxID=568900 RepID=A0A9N8EI34_9STRA|nr:expressed unknown protein [Seminavis robusta]|eukprot:Sro1170_g248670.1 n/a (256) ;mRNA; f:3351-4118